jgi:hypothetical protein
VAELMLQSQRFGEILYDDAEGAFWHGRLLTVIFLLANPTVSAPYHSGGSKDTRFLSTKKAHFH